MLYNLEDSGRKMLITSTTAESFSSEHEDQVTFSVLRGPQRTTCWTEDQGLGLEESLAGLI